MAPYVLFCIWMVRPTSGAPDSNLDLGRRASYRRILAVLKAQRRPFVVVGALATAAHLQRPVEGDLEVYLREDDAPAALAALGAAGFKLEPVGGEGRYRVGYGDHSMLLAWRLPPPLGGAVDAAWFSNSARRSLLDLRLRIAPAEELLWLRIATLGERIGDDLIDGLLLRYGRQLAWDRLLARMAGLEALVLAHLFLFAHRHPDVASSAITPGVIRSLLARLNASANSSAEAPDQPGA